MSICPPTITAPNATQTPSGLGERHVRLLIFLLSLSHTACSFDSPSIGPLSSSRLNPEQIKGQKRGYPLQLSHGQQRFKPINAPQRQPRIEDSALPKDSEVVEVKVNQLSVAREVKNRRAIGEAVSFPHNIGSVWSLAEVYAEGGAAELEMRWWREDRKVSESPFLVSEGLRWREWSKLNVKPTESGEWRVEIYQPSISKVLMNKRFVIEAPTNGSLSKASPQTQNIQKMGNAQSPSTSMDEAQSTPNKANVRTERTTNLALSINSLKIAKHVKRRRPISTGYRFTVNDERLWGYIEVSNLHQPSQVFMEWYRGGELRSRLKVRVGISKRWRTWSWQRISVRDDGQWTVKVISATGETLAETQFIVSD
jgi:hypothetical protein